MNKPIIINLWGAPGTGKSTGAAYIFAKIKMLGVNAELVTEYAKDKVWENNSVALENQLYISAKQAFRISRCADKVDVIITDSPLPLGIIYNQHPEVLGDCYNEVLLKLYNNYNNLNYYITRAKPYNPVGRLQTEEESKELEDKILKLLISCASSFSYCVGNEQGYDGVVNNIMTYLEKNKTK